MVLLSKIRKLCFSCNLPVGCLYHDNSRGFRLRLSISAFKIALIGIISLSGVFAHADQVLFSCDNTGNYVVELQEGLQFGSDMQMSIEYRFVHKPTVDYLLGRGIIETSQLQQDGSFRIKLKNMTGRGGTVEFFSFDNNYASVMYSPHSRDVGPLQFLDISDAKRTNRAVIDLCY